MCRSVMCCRMLSIMKSRRINRSGIGSSVGKMAGVETVYESEENGGIHLFM